MKHQDGEEIEQRKQDKQSGNEGENRWINQQAGEGKKNCRGQGERITVRIGRV